MPLYEYQCENCGELFEVMQKFSDEPLTTHSKCGGKVHRLLSAPALQFKGSGWYITDYAKGSGSSGNGSSSKSGETSSSGSSGEKSGTASSNASSSDKPSGSSSGKKSE
jgi:putative FmdB family regulatory protein